MKIVTLPKEHIALAEELLTAQQFRAYILWQSAFSYQDIGDVLEVSRTRAKTLVTRARVVMGKASDPTR